MTNEDLNNKLSELEHQHALNKRGIMKMFCDANNPYKVGDTFTDHKGTIVIETIKYSYSYSRTPECVYFGLELKKRREPQKKRG